MFSSVHYSIFTIQEPILLNSLKVKIGCSLIILNQSKFIIHAYLSTNHQFLHNFLLPSSISCVLLLFPLFFWQKQFLFMICEISCAKKKTTLDDFLYESTFAAFFSSSCFDKFYLHETCHTIYDYTSVGTDFCALSFFSISQWQVLSHIYNLTNRKIQKKRKYNNNSRISCISCLRDFDE